MPQKRLPDAAVLALRQTRLRSPLWTVAVVLRRAGVPRCPAMTNEAKRHHFVPRLLLRNFASSQADDGRLYVFDKLQRRRFASSPAKVFATTNFYRTAPDQHPTGDGLVVERYLADLESRAAPILASCVIGQPSVSGAAKPHVLHFIAAQLLRNPAWRSWLEGAWLEILEQGLLPYTRSKAAKRRWCQMMAGIGGLGSVEDPAVLLDRMKSGDFTIRTDDQWKIAISMELVPFMMVALETKRWQLMTFSAASPMLVLPDCGAFLVPLGSSSETLVGVMDPFTAVVLPLSPTRAFVGASRSLGLDRCRPDRWVHHLNSSAFAASERQLVSLSDDFVFHLRTGDRTSWTKWLEKGGDAPEMIDKRRKLVEFTARSDDRSDPPAGKAN